MYKQFKTKSGLRVILSPLKETETITVSLMCGAGSRYEDINNNGISHVIEHLSFKGTKKRPTSLDITKELDGVGALFNAYTSKDHTDYYIKIAAEKSELAFDILSDMVFNSKYDPADITKEKEVILEELKMYEDNPSYYIDDLFEGLVFQGHNLDRHIIGTRKSLAGIDAVKIKKYLQQLYRPKNMVLVVAGNFNEQKIKKLITKYFTLLNAGAKIKLNNFTVHQTKPRTFLLSRKTEQVHLALGFPSYGYNNKKLAALQILTMVLGGNMSSRLFINIREKHGLCYFIKAMTNVYQDTGNFVVQAGLDKDRIKLAVTLILEELEKIKQAGITPEELKRAQDFIAGQLVIQMEDSENIANYLGKQEILNNKIITVKEKIQQFKNVKITEVNQAAKAIIDRNKINLAIIGPFANIKSLTKLINVGAKNFSPLQNSRPN